MNMSHPCPSVLRASFLALLSACTGGLDRSDGASGEADALPAAGSPLDAGGLLVDAGLDAGSGPVVDAGLPLGSRPRDRCGPSGEGDLPWAPCDAARGLVCVPPNRGELDAPSTCRCPADKVFTEGACVAQ